MSALCFQNVRGHLTALLAAIAMICGPVPMQANDRLRLIIETDAGGDPDDEQSLVRFLLYVNEWDVEGIIANRREARPGDEVRVELFLVQPARTVDTRKLRILLVAAPIGARHARQLERAAVI